MLKQRLITATILIPIVVWDILYVSPKWFAGFVSLFVVLAAWEWAGICGFTTNSRRILYAFTVGLSLVLAYYCHKQYPSYGIWLILVTACLWWIYALWALWTIQNRSRSVLPTTPLVKALLGILILLPAWIALVILDSKPEGGKWVIFLLVLIWTADSSAYFVGKRWGRLKLADKISPSKTWEGVAGALLSNTLITLVFTWLQGMTWQKTIIFMMLSLLTVIASIVGDLVESAFKRQAHLKDSGQLLPGHGGVLDRIDSLTSAAPIFVMGLTLLE
ncbi:MAG: hypothetical protein BWK79_00995 [Beggiatoa sp. IS2]|nr:MAG: hypothetical protein BWK79_00995 [Beggiatoa sp. IS2]